MLDPPFTLSLTSFFALYKWKFSNTQPHLVVKRCWPRICLIALLDVLGGRRRIVRRHFACKEWICLRFCIVWCIASSLYAILDRTTAFKASSFSSILTSAFTLPKVLSGFDMLSGRERICKKIRVSHIKRKNKGFEKRAKTKKDKDKDKASERKRKRDKGRGWEKKERT